MTDIIPFPVRVNATTITTSETGDDILAGIELFERAVVALERRGIAADLIGVALAIVQAGHARSNDLPLADLRDEGDLIVAELEGEG